MIIIFVEFIDQLIDYSINRASLSIKYDAQENSVGLYFLSGCCLRNLYAMQAGKTYFIFASFRCPNIVLFLRNSACKIFKLCEQKKKKKKKKKKNVFYVCKVSLPLHCLYFQGIGVCKDTLILFTLILIISS